MICRITRGKDFRGILRYAFKSSKQAELIATTATHMDADRVAKEFKAIAARSTRCKHPVSHYVFSVADGEYLSTEDWGKVIAEVVGETGADAYIAVRHGDAKGGHDHAHLIMSRVKLNGRAWSDSHERRHMRRVCMRMEMALGLTKTAERSDRPKVSKDILEQAERLFREGKSSDPVPEVLKRYNVRNIKLETGYTYTYENNEYQTIDR